MSQPYIGEIRMFGGSFAPAGWAMCDGQLMPISENDALFNLIGTTYGGDGQETFGLPDLQGRVPVHPGGALNVQLGEKGGVESVTLTTQQMPIHSHLPLVLSGSGGGASTPTNQTILADCQTTTTNTYTPFNAANAQVQLNNNSITPVGGSQPHDNFQPTLCVTYIISLFGIFPHQ
jgi:microcystin-dependent protein